MAKTWRDDELSLEPLAGQTVAIIGFGSQGEAQALNLRDSGVRVVVGARMGLSFQRANAWGFNVLGLEEAARIADVAAILVPERAHSQVLKLPFRDAASLVFAHGYTVTYRTAEIRSDLQLLLVAPKAIGPQLRRLFEAGSGPPAMIAAEPGDLAIAKAYAKALGCGRSAVIESSFREETETDLFGEQAVLCGGMPALAQAAFDTLVEAGYSPEAAYFECVYEIKLVADLIFERGIAGMVASISDTAQFGAMTAGSRVIGPEARSAMRSLLDAIRSGAFAKQWESEQANEIRGVAQWRKQLAESRLEAARVALAPPSEEGPA